MDGICTEDRTIQIQRPSLPDNLKQKEERLEHELEDVRRARVLLNENLAMAELYDLLLRVGR